MNVDEPAFGPADVAAFLGEKERRIRDLHDRGFGAFFGRRDGYRIKYTIRDIAGAAVARDLVALGFPPRLAARVGAIATYRTPKPEVTIEGKPEVIALMAPEPGSGIPMDRMSYLLPARTASTITIPVGRIWQDVTTKASHLRHARAG